MAIGSTRGVVWSAGRGLASCVVLAAVLVASCGGGGGGGGAPSAGSPSASGPAAPASLALTTANGNVLVDWSEVIGATSYRVYESSTPSIDPTGMPFVEVTETYYQVSGATDGAPLYCVVTSVDADGEGLPSVEQSIMVAPSSPV